MLTSEDSNDDKGIASGVESSDNDWGENKLNARRRKSAIKKEKTYKDKGKSTRGVYKFWNSGPNNFNIFIDNWGNQPFFMQ